MFLSTFRRLVSWVARKSRRSPMRRPGAARFRPWLESLEDRCVPSTIRGVGDSGLWSNAGNWLDDQLIHRLPGPGDDALITPSGITITYDTVATVRSLIVITPIGPNNTIRFTGGELDVTGTAEFDSDSTLAISGGLFNAQGGLAFNHGVLDFSGGAFGSNPVLNAATLNLLSSTPATFILQNASTINGDLAAGQALWVRGSNQLGHTTVTWASGLQNAGTVRLESIDNTWQSALSVSGGTLINTAGGLIQVNAGSGGNRVLTGNLTNLGTLTVGAGTVLKADGSTFTQAGGTTAADGLFYVDSGAFNFTGGAITGSVGVYRATLSVAATVTTPSTVIAAGPSTLTANLSPAVTVWVQGSNRFGHAILTTAAGATNAGTILLQSADDTWRSNLTVSSGLLTNAAGGTIQVNAGSGGERVLTGNVTNLGTVAVSAGAAAKSDGSTFNQAGGTITADGLFYVDSGLFNFTGGVTSGSVAVYRGTLSVAATVTTPSTVIAEGPSTLTDNLSPAVTVWVRGDNRFGHAILTVPGGATNAGTLLLQSADDTWQSTLTIPSGTLTNAASGVIQVNAGSGGDRVLTGNVTNLGTVAVGAGTALDAQSPTFNQAAGQVTADGLFVLDRCTFNLTGGSLAGNVTAYASTLNVSASVTAPSTVIATGPNTLVGNLSPVVTVWVQGNNRVGHATLTTAGATANAGTILLQSVDDTWQSNLNVSSGTLTNVAGGVIQVNAGSGGGRFLSGNLTNAGTTSVGAGTTFTVNGSLSNFSGGTLTGGTYYVAGTFQFSGAALTTNAATIVLDGPGSGIVDLFGSDALANLAANATGASFTVQNGRNFTTAGDFANAGTLTVGAGSTFTTAGAYTQTAGITALASGTLAASGLVDIQAGVLSGSGTVNASVRNNGAVNPGGTGTAGLLSITGDYMQTANGVLNIEIGGANPGSGFDQLAVTGVASLDGTLNVSLLNGFAPESGATFQILTFASAGGTFATVSADPTFLPPVYDPADVTVQAA
jgi:hypothetical protein